MPRYYFHVHDGVGTPDYDGIDLPDLGAAKRLAVFHAGEMMRDDPNAFWDGAEWTMKVTDETGLPLITLFFSASLAA